MKEVYESLSRAKWDCKHRVPAMPMGPRLPVAPLAAQMHAPEPTIMASATGRLEARGERQIRERPLTSIGAAPPVGAL